MQNNIAPRPPLSTTPAQSTLIVNDVSGLNPIVVNNVVKPSSIDSLAHILKQHGGTVSVGGGHFSMGGQTASENSLHIDMSALNRIISFNAQERTICVEAGIRWHDIQELIDQHDLSIKIMQTYSNFTVGGSLSVNAHGRYIGQGPLILSVKSLKLMLADGSLLTLSPTENADIFYGTIGGYGGLGIIVEVTLHLAVNTKMERQHVKLTVENYRQYFFDNIRNNDKAIFHNADLYPPHYRSARAITWVATDEKLTKNKRVVKHKRLHLIEQYFIWVIMSTPFGKWRREHLMDPLIYLFKKRVWRNYEASCYDVAELEPFSRKKNTFILQEYFVPVMKFDEFLPKIVNILQRYQVNALNISVRHAQKDSGSILAWAQEEVFAFVLYYKQKTSKLEKNKIATWTREIIEAALQSGGSYYLPYQLHASRDQFLRAYPRANEWFEIKGLLDPQNRFRNKLWDKYYMADPHAHTNDAQESSQFKSVFLNVAWRDKFYLFLQNIYNIYPENAFHKLIYDTCKQYPSDQEIYQAIQKNLSQIKPFLSDLRYAIPALIKQKSEMTRQTLSLLGDAQKPFQGYIEIGSTGRYLSHLKKALTISGPLFLIHDQAPSYSPADIAERGQIQKLGTYVPLHDYDPIDADKIEDASIDLVTCYIGLHHAPLTKLDGFVRSIWRTLRVGGTLIVRDHDAYSAEMHTFVSLVHAVFNAGLNVTWEENLKELRHFTPLSTLIAYLEQRGFKCAEKQLRQDHDPSDNTLLAFVKC